MGQYWKLANLTKREYVHPHPLGSGLKLVEQVGTFPGPASALLVLLACSNGRGGGDLAESVMVGRWAGDRVVLVGDYTEDSDLGPADHAASIYNLCADPESITAQVAHYRTLAGEARQKNPQGADRWELLADRLETSEPYVDISGLVAEVLESALGFEYKGDGWREAEWPNGDPGRRQMAPDIVVFAGNPPPDPDDPDPPAEANGDSVGES